MKNVWIFILLAAGLVFTIGGAILWQKSAEVMAMLVEGYDSSSSDETLLINATANMRYHGKLSIGVGLLLLHQAVKFHLDMKK